MAPRLYSTGYNGTVRTLEQLLAWEQWQRADPEFARRLLWILDASITAGKPVGIGSIWRSEAAADREFIARHHVVPAGTPGSQEFQGKWWALNPGSAPSAPGKRSYHCDTTTGAPAPFTRRALAVDFTGNLTFVHAHAAEAGLWQSPIEGWHDQPIEIPHSRSKYVLAVHNPLKPFPLPGMPTPAPTRVLAPDPVIRIRIKNVRYSDGRTTNVAAEVGDLQHQCNFWGWRDVLGRNLVVDRQYGERSAQAVMDMQEALGIVVDGIYGPQSHGALQAFLDDMAAFS